MKRPMCNSKGARFLLQGWDHVGKQPQSRKWGKKGKPNGKQSRLTRVKMAKKWPKDGETPGNSFENRFFGPFLAIFPFRHDRYLATPMCGAIRIARPQIASDTKKCSPAMRKPLRCSDFTGKVTRKLPRKTCDVGLRWEKKNMFQDRAVRFGLSLRFGLRCECRRCQIASDVGRAMRATLPFSIAYRPIMIPIAGPSVFLTGASGFPYRPSVPVDLENPNLLK